MAITYEATNFHDFATAGTALSFTPDAGTLAGDVLLVSVASRGQNIVAPANVVDTFFLNDGPLGSDRMLSVFTWKAPTNAPGAVSIAIASGTATGSVTWTRYRGASGFFDADEFAAGNGTVTSWSVPSLAIDVAGCYVAGGAFLGSSTSSTSAFSGGWTKRSESGVVRNQQSTKGVQAAAGASGTATINLTGSTVEGRAWQVALLPADAAPSLTHTLTELSTPTSISAKIKGTNATSARLKVGTNLAVTTGVVYGSSVSLDANGYADLSCTGLSPWTQYYYAVELTGSSVVTTAQVGKAKTLPTPGTPTSFTIGFGSCNEFYDETMSISLTAFTNLNARDPDMFVHLGDISYEDNASSSQASQRAGLEYNLGYSSSFRSAFSGRQSVCLASDHDSGGNNAFPGVWSPAIRAARKQVLPVPDCPDPNGLYGSTVFGRVRMIYLDTRNFMAADFSTRLGSAQLAWLEDQLAEPEPLKIIWTEQVWNDYSVPEGDDKWCNFPERTTIGNMIAAAVGTVIMAHGDSHMLAADDGTNNDWGGFPTVCAAAFYNYSSIKGDATWTQGTWPTAEGPQVSQYGMFAITDAGGDITVQFNGYDSGNTSRVALTVVAEASAPAYSGSLAITAGGTLARTPTAMTAAGTLGMTAGGTLGRAPSGMSVAGTLATTASGTLSRTGSPGLSGVLGMSSSGSLAFTATPMLNGSLEIVAGGTLVTGSSSFIGTLAMTAGGTLALSGSLHVSGSLVMSGTGTLSFNGVPAITQSLNITATGTLGRTGRPAVSGLLAMGGTGTLSMTPVVAGDSRAQGFVGGQIRDINLVLRFDGVDYPVTLVAKVDGEEYPLNHGITPPPEGLAARWTFDDGVEDEIAGRTLALTDTTLVAARGGQALAAPTATGTADSEDGFLDLMGFSIAYWLYTPDNASTVSITRVAFTAAGVTVAELYSGWRSLAGSIYDLSRLSVTTDTGTLNTIYQMSTGGSVIPAQQWRHVVGVYDGAEMLLYVNGALVDSDPKTGVVTDPDAFTIRVQSTALVDDVEIWSRPLSAAEIAARYEEGL